MKRTIACTVVAVLLATINLDSQPVSKDPSRSNTRQPEAFVRSFYHLVVLRHPVSIDTNELKVFAPYLSKALRDRIAVTSACSVDWNRQNPPPPVLKPPFGWLESGLFSGANEKALPRLYHVEKAQPEKNGSFRVPVRLTYGPPEALWIWEVAAIVVREDGHFVIDDVIYLKDKQAGLEEEYRLSQVLAEGCDGPHWVGYKDEQ